MRSLGPQVILGHRDRTAGAVPGSTDYPAAFLSSAAPRCQRARPDDSGTKATSNSATIHWSAPSLGPRPSRYVIEQDGVMVGSVPGTVIRYHATGLIPDTFYKYQVIAVRDGYSSLPSSPLRVRSQVPPVSAAILIGSWFVRYTNVSMGDFGGPRLTADTWNFTPDCATAQCPVALTGTLNGNQFTATLDRSGTDYKGSGTNNSFASCGSTPITSNLTFRIKVLTAGVAEKNWAATSWSGTLTIDIPATDCAADTVTAIIHVTR